MQHIFATTCHFSRPKTGAYLLYFSSFSKRNGKVKYHFDFLWGIAVAICSFSDKRRPPV
jgi:hypothetical protein